MEIVLACKFSMNYFNSGICSLFPMRLIPYRISSIESFFLIYFLYWFLHKIYKKTIFLYMFQYQISMVLNDFYIISISRNSNSFFADSGALFYPINDNEWGTKHFNLLWFLIYSVSFSFFKFTWNVMMILTHIYCLFSTNNEEII